MDGERFDQIARTLATGATRRRVLRGLLAGALTGGLHAQGGTAAPPPCTRGGACTTPAGCCPAERCVAGRCEATPGGNNASCVATGCPGSADPCQLLVCNTNTGACESGDVADGTPCEDGNFCTVNDTCQTGACAPGTPRDCGDGNACTTDSCDQATGACVNEPLNGAPCEDGDVCTQGDSCQAGACQPGPLKTCVPCSMCENIGGVATCVEDPSQDDIACGDGQVCCNGNCCVTGQTCASGACVHTCPEGTNCGVTGSTCPTRLSDGSQCSCVRTISGERLCAEGFFCPDSPCASDADCGTGNVCISDDDPENCSLCDENFCAFLCRA